MGAQGGVEKVLTRTIARNKGMKLTGLGADRGGGGQGAEMGQCEWEEEDGGEGAEWGQGRGEEEGTGSSGREGGGRRGSQEQVMVDGMKADMT